VDCPECRAALGAVLARSIVLPLPRRGESRGEGEAWDRRIEDDVAAGPLDAPADEALGDLRAGRCTER
jgi:hypothetical protein